MTVSRPPARPGIVTTAIASPASGTVPSATRPCATVSVLMALSSAAALALTYRADLGPE